MLWGGVKDVELPIEEEVKGAEEGVKGVELPVREGVDSWLPSSICSFNLFMYVSFDFLTRSCLLGSFATFFDVSSMFILSKNGKG